jgi:hypothetical protein
VAFSRSQPADKGHQRRTHIIAEEGEIHAGADHLTSREDTMAVRTQRSGETSRQVAEISPDSIYPYQPQRMRPPCKQWRWFEI